MTLQGDGPAEPASKSTSPGPPPAQAVDRQPPAVPPATSPPASSPQFAALLTARQRLGVPSSTALPPPVSSVQPPDPAVGRQTPAAAPPSALPALSPPIAFQQPPAGGGATFHITSPSGPVCSATRRLPGWRSTNTFPTNAVPPERRHRCHHPSPHLHLFPSH